MAFEPKAFPLEGRLNGISDRQIQEHRDILYKGYVAKWNEILSRLQEVDRSKANGIYSEFGELKREETFAQNGTVLHELYFENLGGAGGSPTGKFADLVKRDFGSVDKWLDDFKACAVAARGWAVTALSFYDMKLHNYLLDTHHFNVPIGVVPFLVLDVYEHSYVIDQGVKRAPYIEAFLKSVNWNVVNTRISALASPVKL